MSYLGGALQYKPEYWYPNLSGYASPSRVGDLFSRQTFQPTNQPSLYTVTAVGAGTAATAITAGSGGNLVMTTGAAGAGDNVDIVFNIAPQLLDLGTALANQNLKSAQKKFVCQFALGQTAATEMFIGVTNLPTALTAVPTVRDAGLIYDASVGANFLFTEAANAGGAVNTDTGQAADTSVYVLTITMGASSSGSIGNVVIQLLNSTTGAVIATRTNATNIFSPKVFLHWFVQTEGAAAKVLNIRNWFVDTI